MDRCHVEDFLHVLLCWDRLLFARLPLLLTRDNGADRILGVLLLERIEPDIFLPLLAERQVLATLDCVPGLLEQVEKGIKGVRMLGQRVVDGDARKLSM